MGRHWPRCRPRVDQYLFVFDLTLVRSSPRRLPPHSLVNEFRASETLAANGDIPEGETAGGVPAREILANCRGFRSRSSTMLSLSISPNPNPNGHVWDLL